MRAGERAVLCVAGEPSGDALLAPVVEALGARGYRAIGVGGPLSVAAGLSLLAPYEGLAASGFIDAVGTVPATVRAYRRLSAACVQTVAAVFVDFPEVNTRLLRRVAKMGRPSLYIAPPQAWAWRPWRARRLRLADEIGCLFRFEAEWYQRRGVSARFVGHPLATQPAPPVESPDVALLPGSRWPKVRRLLPIMARALDAAGVSRAHLGVAPGLAPAAAQRLLRGTKAEVVIHRGATAALARSGVALVGAGTATLDCAVAGRPMVVLGKVHPLSAPLARTLIDTPLIGLPNIILGREAFPECVQSRCTGLDVARALDAVAARGNDWASILSELRHALAGPGWPTALWALLDAVLDRR